MCKKTCDAGMILQPVFVSERSPGQADSKQLVRMLPSDQVLQKAARPYLITFFSLAFLGACRRFGIGDFLEPTLGLATFAGASGGETRKRIKYHDGAPKYFLATVLSCLRTDGDVRLDVHWRGWWGRGHRDIPAGQPIIQPAWRSSACVRGRIFPVVE